ncbi:hypothetical protein [uncultured Roseibium sp.]|uniref:hypothetical protein n=1 Tax=uncultured Roseibium sp. TaxID=1936171 RepID=UPI0032177BFC
MIFLVEMVKHTPLWVWGVLIYVCYASYQQTRDRAARPVVMLVFPVLFFLLAAVRLARVEITGPVLEGLAMGTIVAAGALLALKPARGTTMEENGAYRIRSDYFAALLFPATFVTFYVLAVLSAVDPSAKAGPAFQIVSGGISSLSTSYTAFRVIAYFRTGKAAARRRLRQTA